MLYEMLCLIKWLPKVTLSYVLFSLIYGISVNNFVIGATAILDLIDYTIG